MISSGLASSLSSETAPARVGSVPFQFIGEARQLRQRIHEAAKEATADQEKLLKPLRAIPGKTLMPRHAYMQQLAKRWKRLNSFGRLRLVSKFDPAAGRLQLVEIRLLTSTIQIEEWTEPAIAVGLQIVTMQPPQPLKENRVILAVVGLHATARRQQRCTNNSDHAIFEDFFPLARSSLSVIQGHDFTIETPSGGAWLCIYEPRKFGAAILARTYR